MVRFSFIVPAFNEEKNIPLLYGRILALTKRMKGSWELLFINDGSRDRTAPLLDALCKKDRRVKALHFSRNFGHQAALTAGLDHCDGDAVISLDCDLQDPPEVIEKMIARWEAGDDIVYARRSKRHDRFLKKLTADGYYWLLAKVADVRIPRNVGDFRLMSRAVVETIRDMPENNRYLRGMVAWTGFRYSFVDFDRPERIHGETAYTWRKMMKLAFDGIWSFSQIPLKLGVPLAALSVVFGSLAMLYMLYDHLVLGTEYQLYKWVVIIITMMISLLYVQMWIIGEYVGRIYNQSRGRPLYIVRRKSNLS